MIPEPVTIPDPQGGRNLIRPGDSVRVAPSRPGRRDGFVATYRRAVIDESGRAVEVEVVGGPNAAIRTFRPERIRRKRATA